MTKAEFVDLGRVLTASRASGTLYLVERTKEGADVSYRLWRTEATPPVGNRLRVILASELIRYDKVTDLEFSRYDLGAEAADKPVIEWLPTREVPHCDEILDTIARHVDVALAEDMQGLLPKLWAYAVDVSAGDRRCVYFRKYSQGKVLRGSLIDVVFVRGGRLSAVEDDLLCIDERVDCVCVDDELFIINRAAFEMIFNYVEQYIDTARGVIETLEKSGCFDNPGALLDYGTSDYRKIKRLAAAASIVAGGGIGPDFIDKVMEMRERFGLSFDVDEETRRIIVARSSIWDIIKLLADDFLVSDLTDERYEVQSKRRRAQGA